MIVFNETIKASLLNNDGIETKLSGRAVSRGLAMGKVVCLYGRKRQFYRITLDDPAIKTEIRRFRAAVITAKTQIRQLISGRLVKKTDIFDTHLLIFEDKSLLSKIEDQITRQKVNAEWAVKTVTDGYIASYKNISDEHLRDRYIDLEDIAERLQTALGGSDKSALRLEKNSIIVAKEVNPSTLIELTESNPQAIVTENGGWTSHTFILARELSLPSITGIKGILRLVQTGDQVIVDAFQGHVILNPNESTRQSYQAANQKLEQQEFAKTEITGGKTKTLDGKLIKLRANLDLPKGYSEAKKIGADGIGLYRSEYLFNQYKGFPTEEEQVAAYRKISKPVGSEGVRIRTFDLTAEQVSDENQGKEKNPALGLRAIRLSLSYQKMFRTQLRALLRASSENNISVILPMISDVAEVRRTKKLLADERRKLQKRGVEVGKLPVGSMIEVPSAILTIEEIAAESDFLCLGTNDLVQYLLAVDRDNETVADWFRTLHPAVLRSIKLVVKAAESADIPVIVCGEMAGSPVYVPILIGLGVTELSMNINSIARVKKIISAIAFEEAVEIVKKLEKCQTSDQIEAAIQNLYLKKWTHLFTAELLPPQK